MKIDYQKINGYQPTIGEQLIAGFLIGLAVSKLYEWMI